jgi:hypothetical protein
MWFFAVGTFVNQLGSGMLMYRPMQLVLHFGKEVLS